MNGQDMIDDDTDGRLSHTTREDQHESVLSADEARGLSFEDRMSAFRSEMYSNVLPTLPPIDGYHLCWVSTTSQSDTPQKREGIGYSLVKPEDVPGFEHVSVTSGTYAGCVMLNELIAMKIPLKLYYGYMGIAHHERPMQHQQKMGSQLQNLRQNGDGVEVRLADGSQSFMRASAEPRPMFEK